MVRIRGDILIDRPPEDVFDVVADERNEPCFNPRMSACELESEGPVGAGTRFSATLRSVGRSIPMTVELTGYDRPRRLRSRSIVPGARIVGELVFEPEGTGTRMRWSWEVQARGPARLLGPVVSRLGDHRERQIWDNLRTLLESEWTGRPDARGAARRPRLGPRVSDRAAECSPVGALRRRAYRGGRAGGATRAVNRAQGFVHSIGIWPSRLATLEVVGRRTGRTISVPVVIAEYGDERYLVAMLGDKANWVRNVEAAGGRAVLRHGRRERVRLEPVPVEDRPPILRRYLECAPGARAHFPVDRRAPVEQFAGVAATTPVFRIGAAAAGRPGSGASGIGTDRRRDDE